MSLLKKILAGLGIVLLLGAGYLYYGTVINPKSPKGIATYEKEDVKVEVVYHRPYKNDRLIFGSAEDGALVPYDQYWRLGANAATTFETSTEISFGGRLLSPGTYRMYAIPANDHWVVALNEEFGKFGYYEPDYDKDVMRISIASAQLLTPVEQFTIALLEDGDDLTLSMRWDTTAIAIPLN